MSLSVSISYCPQEGGDRKFLLPVDVGIHDLLTSVANSIQEPLKGIILAEYNFVPFVCLL